MVRNCGWCVGGVRTSGRCSDSSCCVNGLLVLVQVLTAFGLWWWRLVIAEVMCRYTFRWESPLGF